MTSGGGMPPLTHFHPAHVLIKFICICDILSGMSKPKVPDWTTVRLAGPTWRRLNGEKLPGESFDGTINRLIDQSKALEAK